MNKGIGLLILFNLVFISFISYASAQPYITVVYDDFSGTTINQSLWTNTTLVDVSGGVARVGQGGGGNTNSTLNSTFSFKPFFISNINISTGLDGTTGANDLQYQIYLQNQTGRILIFNNTVPSGGNARNNLVFSINSSNNLDTYRNGTLNTTFSNIDITRLGNLWKIVYEVRKFGGMASGEVLYVEDLNYTFKLFNSNSSYPFNNSNIINNNINFTLNATGNIIGKTNITFLNSTLYVWNFNSTLRSILTNTITGGFNISNFSITGLETGRYIWNFLTCTTLDLCSFSDTNNTFLQGFTENNISYNGSTYETSYEGFRLNITLPSSIVSSSATLYYGGTAYSTTKSVVGPDTIFTTNFDAPLVNQAVVTNNFYWALNLDGTLINTTSNVQRVTQINLTICNGAPQNIPFINFTFKDENTLNMINASTDLASFSYYLSSGSGLVNKTLLYQNSTELPSFAFCFTPSNKTLSTSVSYKYSATNYPQRTWLSSYSLTNTSTSQILYLLNEADGIYVTFQYVTGTGNIISGVSVYAERDISGIPTIISQGITDASGSVTFWLNPNFQHTIVSSKNGCTSSQFTITPTQTSYTITMHCTRDSDYDTSPIPGIIFQKTPPSGPLANGSTYFNYSVFTTTNNVSITKAKFQLLYSNGTVINTNETLVSSGFSFCTSQQCNLSLLYNVKVGDDLKARYYVDVGEGYVLIEGDAHWRAIRPSPARTLSLKNALQDLRTIFSGWTSPSCSYSNDGLQGTNCTLDELELQNKLEYSRIVFFFLFLSIIMALLGRTTGYDGANPGVFIYIVGGIILLGSLAGGLDGEGFFYYSNLTPFHFLNNYILAFTMIMMMVGYWCMLSRRQT